MNEMNVMNVMNTQYSGYLMPLPTISRTTTITKILLVMNGQ